MYFLLQKETDVPAYQQIVEAICNQVRDGRLVSGEKVDTELELAARLGVSRPTIRRAYERLKLMGVLTSTRGRGSMIAADAPQVLGVKQRRAMRKIGFLVSAIGRMSQIPPYHRHQVYDALERFIFYIT